MQARASQQRERERESKPERKREQARCGDESIDSEGQARNRVAHCGVQWRLSLTNHDGLLVHTDLAALQNTRPQRASAPASPAALGHRVAAKKKKRKKKEKKRKHRCKKTFPCFAFIFLFNQGSSFFLHFFLCLFSLLRREKEKEKKEQEEYFFMFCIHISLRNQSIFLSFSFFLFYYFAGMNKRDYYC
jgi:hypothetical protein